MTAFHMSRRILAQAEAGKPIDEGGYRVIRGELDRADANLAAPAPAPMPDLNASRITTDEAVAALAMTFDVLEAALLDLRRNTRGDLVIAPQVADAFIAAQDVLKRAGHEPVARRRHSPLTLTPLLSDAERSG